MDGRARCERRVKRGWGFMLIGVLRGLGRLRWMGLCIR